MERACYHNAVTLQPSHSGDDVGLVLYGTKTRNASCSAETESCARMRAVPPAVHLDPRYFSGQGGQKKMLPAHWQKALRRLWKLVTLPKLFNLV
jgi:hypothetical protein